MDSARSSGGSSSSNHMSNMQLRVVRGATRSSHAMRGLYEHRDE